MTSPSATATAVTNQRIFRVRQLTKTYGMGAAEVHALAGVDLDLYAGELVVLLVTFILPFFFAARRRDFL